MIFELINPSDKCTFEAPNLKIAALVTCVLGNGQYSEKEYKYRANIDKTVQEQKTNLPKENTPAVSDLKSSHIVENTRAKVASVLSTQKAIVPQATTKAKPSLNNQNRLLTNVTPFKQPLNTPNPQEVVVVNQNNGNIGQNVSDRFLAHALTGGIGMYKNEA
ncbi:hypothetical protein [Acinetobacter baumannii]|uniref:hypothetical protein n=1 Tax=Acinetobacter baumannii TaxID=470 RepID=UPI00138EF90A|nr:hypothetical protein [Acinetobacter baumannii]NDM09794.1 hypothetical protein [Acinetobacter baumannii]